MPTTRNQKLLRQLSTSLDFRGEHEMVGAGAMEPHT
jgi:hypothetical protein